MPMEIQQYPDMERRAKSSYREVLLYLEPEMRKRLTGLIIPWDSKSFSLFSGEHISLSAS